MIKYLLILLVMLLSCPTVHAENDPTAKEIIQAEEIMMNGIEQNDAKKPDKVALVIKYLVYNASIGNQNALIASTEFLSNYQESLNSLQKADIKTAQDKIVSSYIQQKDLGYSNELFIQKTKDLLNKTRAFETTIKNFEPTSDEAALVWFKYITRHFDAFAFKDQREPGIDRLLAEQMVAENGLFAYMLNKIKLLSNTDKKLKDAYYVSLLALNEIILSDARTQSRETYKGFKVPDICLELRTLKDYEETIKETDFRFANFKEAVGRIYKSAVF